MGGARVDLVRQQHIGEHGTSHQLELSGVLSPDPGPHNVRRQDVGGKLHPAGVAADGFRENLGQKGLAQTGVVLKENVTIGQGCRQQLSQQRPVPHEHLGHSVDYFFADLPCFLRAQVGHTITFSRSFGAPSADSAGWRITGPRQI